MTTLAFSFDTTFELLVALSVSLIVLSSFWIVGILLQIERTKVAAFSPVSKDGDGTTSTTTTTTTTDDDLAFEESTSTTGYKQQEEEDGVVKSPTRGIEIELPVTDSPHVSPNANSKSSSSPNKDGILLNDAIGHSSSSSSLDKSNTATNPRRVRRLPWSFVGMQVASVLALILLTYLVLVVSNAPIPLRLLGSLCVFFIFLRFQIGDELRRQRIDRILLLVSLFLVIASMLSLCIYSFKTLKQGEVYEGPARIVGYDASQYNNTQHDPTTRTDIAVSWGKDWGCPLSGGKVCQARISGAMCQVHPEQTQTKHKTAEGDHDGSRRQTRRRQQRQQQRQRRDWSSSSTTSSSSSSSMGAAASAIESSAESEAKEEAQEVVQQEEQDLEEDLEDEESENQNLEEENETLKEQNEELEKEVEELKEENEVEEEEQDAIIDEADSEIYEVEEEYAGEVMDIEGQEYENAETYEDKIHETVKEKLEEELKNTDDPDKQAEIEEEIDETDEDEKDIDEEYQEVAEEYQEYGSEYMDEADQDWEDALDAEDEYEAAEDEKDELEEEIDETEEEITEEQEKNNYGSASNMDDVVAKEEAEIEEEYEEEEYGDDWWYWDEYPDSYDDDFYEDEYWQYDWDSVWGEYACEDLFDNDMGAHTYDPNTPAGGDDEWPFVYIYGSCKTCEAYILDYFAEEAFEGVEDLKTQAIMYLAGALVGFSAALAAYLKYRVMPTPANQVELLGYDGGVLA